MTRRLRTLFALAVLGCGCTPRPVQQTGPHEPELTRQYRSGSITVNMAVSHTNLTSAGDTRLTLDVQAPERIDVVFPEVVTGAESLGVWERYAEPPRILPNGKVLHRQVWILVPTLPGRTTLPALNIVAGATILQTDPVGMEVASLLPADLDSLVIKDIASPVEILPGQRTRRLAGLTVLGISALLLVGIAGIRRRRRQCADPAMPPHQAALQALLDLHFRPAEPVTLIHQVDRILRGYLEARFAIPALESTQGELSLLLDEPDLVAFLAQCDDIKFSHVVPPGFPEEAIGFARNYIETTGREAASCD